MTEKNGIDTFMQKYVKNSQPKTSWDNEPPLNHIKLVQLLKNNYPDLVVHAKGLFDPKHLETIDKLLKDEFTPLLSPQRIMLIQKCLTLRFNILFAIINQ